MAEPFLGEIRSFSFGVIPQGWAACNGQLLNVNHNQALFTLLSNRYGGDGKVTFGLPNLQGRVPIAPVQGDVIGTMGGEATHTLTISEMPAHTHDAIGGSDGTQSVAAGNTWGTSSGMNSYSNETNDTMNAGTLTAAGNSQGHPNMQPYLTLNYCIAIQGIWPPRN